MSTTQSSDDFWGSFVDFRSPKELFPITPSQKQAIQEMVDGRDKNKPVFIYIEDSAEHAEKFIEDEAPLLAKIVSETNIMLTVPGKVNSTEKDSLKSTTLKLFPTSTPGEIIYLAELLEQEGSDSIWCVDININKLFNNILSPEEISNFNTLGLVEYLLTNVITTKKAVFFFYTLSADSGDQSIANLRKTLSDLGLAFDLKMIEKKSEKGEPSKLLLSEIGMAMQKFGIE